MSENNNPFSEYWYIACESKDLKTTKPLARTILNETLVLFRDSKGKPIAMQDRCPHRNFKLSKGRVEDDCLRCPYHGWKINSQSVVIDVPAEGPHQRTVKARSTKKYECLEIDDFIYVSLASDITKVQTPFRMPKYKEPGYKTVRLFNVFKNNVLNCAENYVDVPHTVFVHDKIFRVSRQEKVEATVERVNGSVIIDYQKETDNLGWFSWFLNPKKTPIKHTDHFHAPNITSVEYIFGPKREFYISSHCTPVSDDETHVYTDLTFNFGVFNAFAAPIVRYQGQAVIDQDIEVLNTQMEVIKKYGTHFQNSKADIVHVLIESVRDEIKEGRDPKALPYKKQHFEFWI
ncbi:MAG: Rieske 2Fe-2S domain-containing protein [Bacteriovoracaceae bacterium]|nr:Rieske 2Fe-2S domain-containing protein [Bacteriovoracaceae bacterium]